MIVLMGMAGSGKGTQGKALSEIFGWRWLSVGEAIREAGGYEEIINAGHLIPDEDVIELMNRQIEKAEDEGFDLILDGYPRDEFQAKYVVENMAEKIDGVIVLVVPREELLERLALRGRDDDKERASIERRFDVFVKNAQPILDLFAEAGVPIERVDGVGKIEEVTKRLVAVVERMNPEATEQRQDVNGGEIERSYGE
ncbi:nucleoside monophosphate kinase [Candidatus Saccharibacteria bacterium]|nr:nucleoside monophosphate kinase [Candidatus Saccharibacteria bacterium]